MTPNLFLFLFFSFLLLFSAGSGLFLLFLLPPAQLGPLDSAPQARPLLFLFFSPLSRCQPGPACHPLPLLTFSLDAHGAVGERLAVVRPRRLTSPYKSPSLRVA